jgi:hypothetical protein
MSDSYKPILNREYGNGMASQFKDSIDLLNEVLDYGSRLIPRAFVSSLKDIKAFCLIFVQLREFLAHLDAIAILLDAGNSFSANLQLRSLLEISHTMEWLLKSDTDPKVNHLYVANVRKRRHWQSIAIAGTREAMQSNDSGKRARLALTSEQLGEINDEIVRIDTILTSIEFASINTKFESHYSTRGFDRTWYEVYGSSSRRISIRKIAEEIGRLEEYKNVYSSLSTIAHGGDMWKNMFSGNKGVSVNEIREPQGIPSAVEGAVGIAFRVFAMILKEYRPGELPEDFARKLRGWQHRLRKEYQIKITPKYTNI